MSSSDVPSTLDSLLLSDYRNDAPRNKLLVVGRPHGTSSVIWRSERSIIARDIISESLSLVWSGQCCVPSLDDEKKSRETPPTMLYPTAVRLPVYAYAEFEDISRKDSTAQSRCDGRGCMYMDENCNGWSLFGVNCRLLDEAKRASRCAAIAKRKEQ